MDDEGTVRLEWLKHYCRKQDLVDDDGHPSPTKLADKTGKKVSYCSDLLRGQKSFGAAAARGLEKALGLPKWALEGGAGWPFPTVDREKWERLTAVQRNQIEGMVRLYIDQFAAENQSAKRA